jgi:hypothetical protein
LSMFCACASWAAAKSGFNGNDFENSIAAASRESQWGTIYLDQPNRSFFVQSRPIVGGHANLGTVSF